MDKQYTQETSAILPILTEVELFFWGCLAALSLPGYNLTALALFAYAPLFWHCFRGRRLPKLRLFHSTRLALLFWLGYFLIGQWWALELHPLSWIGFSSFESRWISVGVWLSNALFMAILYTGVVVLWNGWLQWVQPQELDVKNPKNLYGTFFWVIGVGLIWAAYSQVLQSLHWIPYWLSPEMGLATHQRLSGVLQGTRPVLWGGAILSMNAFGAWILWDCFQKRRASHWILSGFALLAVLSLLLHVPRSSFGSLGNLLFPKEEASIGIGRKETLDASGKKRGGLRVAALSGDCSIEGIRGGKGFQSQAKACRQTYQTLLTKLTPQSPYLDLVVFPEEGPLAGFIPEWERAETELKNPLTSATLNKSLTKSFIDYTAWVDQTRVPLVLGSPLRLPSEPSFPSRYFNTLWLLTPQADNASSQSSLLYLNYTKQRLVPFGEWAPSQATQLLTQFFPHLSYDAAFYTLPESTPWQLPSHPVQLVPHICYEARFLRPVSLQPSSGAKVLLLSSNLGWFHNSRLLRQQHLALAQWQAVQSKAPVVMVSNVGATALIQGKTGRILQELPIGKPGILTGNLAY
jgi:apolipoprotein N-acyltransferase